MEEVPEPGVVTEAWIARQIHAEPPKGAAEKEQRERATGHVRIAQRRPGFVFTLDLPNRRLRLTEGHEELGVEGGDAARSFVFAPDPPSPVCLSHHRGDVSEIGVPVRVGVDQVLVLGERALVLAFFQVGGRERMAGVGVVGTQIEGLPEVSDRPVGRPLADVQFGQS